MGWAKKSYVHVHQKGRFENDEAFWGDHLSAHKVEVLHHAKELGFALSTLEDYKFFQDAMEQEIAGFHWTLAQADGDEEEENEDDCQ